MLSISYIKRNNIYLNINDDKIINKLFSSRESFEILTNAYNRIICGDGSSYSKNINLMPSVALAECNNHKKYHIFNNPLYRYFNYDKILEYANKHIKIYHTLSKFENDNNMGRNISIFAISSKVFGARYNLEYTIKMQDILIDVILNNKNVTVDSLVEIIKDFANKNNLTYSTPRLSAIKNLIDKVNKYPNIYKELDKFVRLYTTSPVCERYEFLYNLIGDDINSNHIKNSLPFFSLRSSIFNDKNHNK